MIYLRMAFERPASHICAYLFFLFSCYIQNSVSANSKLLLLLQSKSLKLVNLAVKNVLSVVSTSCHSTENCIILILFIAFSKRSFSTRNITTSNAIAEQCYQLFRGLSKSTPKPRISLYQCKWNQPLQAIMHLIQHAWPVIGGAAEKKRREQTEWETKRT